MSATESVSVTRLRRNVCDHCYEPEHGQREPEQEDKLEGVVEGEPVDNAQSALNDTAMYVSDTDLGSWPIRWSGSTYVNEAKTTQYCN